MLSDQFADVVKLLDVIEHRIPFTTDRVELGAALCEAVELGHRVTALTSQLALAATINGVAASAGQRTVGQYVAARTNSQAIEIDRQTKTAKWLRDFPIFAAAFGRELTEAHVAYLRKNLAADYEMRAKLAADQEFFVETAATCSFAGFEEACDYWLNHVDPDGKEPQDQIEKSSFRIRKGQGGRGEISGTCDALTRQSIDTAVEHEAAKLRRDDLKNGIERTDSQRRMAALVNLVTRGFAREDGSFPAPLCSVVMSLKVAEWARGVLAGEIDPGDTVPVDRNDPDGRCELIDGTPIHPFLALMALGDHGLSKLGQPNLRRYVMEADSRLLDVSVNARSFPEWMSTAALVQSRGKCDTHGCDAPHSWLETDHIDPVADGGETEFGNAQPQCRPDNQAKAATTGHTAWRDKQTPPRRQPRRPGATRRGDRDPDDDSDTAEPIA